MTGDCEFITRVRLKTGHESIDGPGPLVVLCSLTGRQCFCEVLSPYTCTRRTWALKYSQRLSEGRE